ncbi:hypothetical protein K493DRAFT_316990 [Basidiobolus meristosporus CBS 931.73]|uniref:CigA protein n=1 Tax=Basidiobolus meristosporus CBS 931.73 TaxID=1314790 RepID=A0A1Y1Y2I9_9FUNG|nr:hypothetical protein K493DRAFT_316990 [Basidiobolus meristosporus CBS 931.73]|eukprot:ORX91834.1 hypothetical protein K493DRAFT_316990 [Basidiobolus meristosporus CBS 931.73]
MFFPLRKIVVVLGTFFGFYLLLKIASPFQSQSSKVPTLYKLRVKPDEKFVTYLSHSGFHNQRIELENALFLAKKLNRSLLLPPAMLGPPLPWRPFNVLHDWLLSKTKKGLDHCKKLSLRELPLECAGYETWSKLPWTYFFDLNPLLREVRIYQREEFDYDELQQFGIHSFDDIHYIKDQSTYDYMILDQKNDTIPLKNYNRQITIDELGKIDAKLLYFGSIFGTTRVQATTPKTKQEFNGLRDRIIYNTEPVLSVTKKIVKKLGGSENFYGIHLRTSDYFFAENLEENVGVTVDNMQQALSARAKNKYYPDPKPSEVTTYDPRAPPTLKECLNRPRHVSFASPIIYLATDARNIRQSKVIRPLLTAFPCTFILDDFKSDLFELSHQRNPQDEIVLTPHLIPMVDATVASRGKFFVGTPKSTFSKYTRRLHNVYFGREDPIKFLV